MTRTNRCGGVEIFRILCCLLVIESHIILEFFPRPEKAENLSLWIVVICFLVTFNGVNNHGFMCITGYYGTKLKWEKLFSYLCMIVCYSWIGLLIHMVAHDPVDFESIVKGVFPVSTGHYWYATAYFVLTLLSPYLNLLPERTDRVLHRRVVFTVMGLFLILPTVLYWGPNGSYNTDWIVMIVYYIIVQYIRKYKLLDRIKTVCLILIAGSDFAGMVILNMLCTRFAGAAMPFGYFMPFSRGCTVTMLVFVLALFELFRRLPIQVGWIRWMAGFTFSAYIMEGWIRRIVEYYIEPSELVVGYGGRFVVMMTYSVIVFVTSIGIELIRRLLTAKMEAKLWSVISLGVARIHECLSVRG